MAPAKDPAVAAHNADDMKIFCFTAYTGQNAADTADDHVDFDACAGGLLEFFNNIHVGDGVDFN